MRYSVLILTALIFSVQSSKKHKHRTVNVALETSLLFEPKDLRSNLGIVDNIRTFLDKIYNTLEPQTQVTYRQHEEPKSLPHFLNNLGTKVLNFSNENIQHFAQVLKQHVHSYTTKARSSYHEIFSDPELKNALHNILEKLANTDGKKVKKKLHKFMRSDKPTLRSFTEQLDKFYTEKDLEIFNKFVRKLDRYAKKKKDMSKVVREWLDFGIFNRYNKLNFTSKVKLLNDMRLLKDYLNGGKKFRAADQENEIDVSGSEGDGVHKHHRHTKGEETKHKHQNGSKERGIDGRKTEVIVDNVEFFIKTDD